MKAHKPRRRSVAESLETRRLLAFQFSGTPGDDTILVQFDHAQQEYRFTLNGSAAGATEDLDIIIFAGAGNDSVILPFVHDESDITVRGGSGNDTLEVGSGNLSTDLRGRVLFEDIAEGIGGSGNADQLIANDSLDNIVPDRSIVFRQSDDIFLTHALYSNGGGPGGGSVHFDQLINIVTLLSSTSADTVYVEAAPRGMSLSLGGGNDTVMYGDRSSDVLEDLLPSGTVDGGAGVDRIVFDDANGPELEGRVYDFSSATAMNQRLFDVEQMEVITRDTGGVGGGHPDNDLLFSGLPVSSTVTINGGGLGDQTYIGTPTSPIDLDDLAVTLTTTNPGYKYVYDQDDDNVNSVFVIATGGSPLRQFVNKGAFSAGFIPVSFDVNRNIDIHGGSSSDAFVVFGTLANRNIGVFGGGGNDELHNATADLDAVFLSPLFYAGGDGNDQLLLFDSQDQTNDDDNEYRLLPSLTGGWIFDKAGSGGQTMPAITYSDSVEQIWLQADDGPSTIRFQGLPTQQVTIHGGGGDDFITNARAGQNGSLVLDSPGSAVVTGDAGNDTISINDQANGLVTEYALNASQFQFRSGLNAPRTMTYDGSTENFFLDQSNASTTTHVDGKLSSLRLNVSTFGGDDVVIVGGGDIDSSGITSSTTTLLGGSGNDRIEFDDHLDEHNLVNADTFSFHFQQVIKDSTTIIYGGFESQKLITSGVKNPSLSSAYIVRINAIDIPTEVEGGAGVRNNMVDVGININQLFAPITLSFANAPVVVNLNDQFGPAARTYQFTATQMSAPVVVNYVGVEELYVYAGSASDTLNVTGTPAGMDIFLNGGTGDEMMSLGSSSGALTDLAGRVFAAGGDGVDRVFFTNGVAGGFTDGVLTGGSFRANGGPNHLYQAELVNVTLNDSGSNINVTSLASSAGITGGGGDDLVTVGAGDLDVNILGTMFMFGGGGFDRLVIDDRNGTNQPGTPAEYRFDVFNGTAGPVDRLNSFITCLEVEQRQFDASNDANLINVIDTVGDLRLNTNGGNDTINITDATGLVTLDTGSGSDSVTLNTDSGTAGDGPVTVLFDTSDDVHHLDVRAGATLRIGPGATLLKTTGVNSGLGLNGVIDLAGGAMLFRAAANVPSQASFRSRLIAGHNGGSWNGTGLGAINSSLAAQSLLADGVGYGLGSQVAPTTIGPFSIAADDTLIRYSLAGDADLNGQVNLADFNRLASSFGKFNKVWVDGDSNYDDLVSLSDFNALAGNFGQSAAPLGERAGTNSSTEDQSLERLLSEPS